MRFSSLTFILLAAGASLGFAAPLDKSSAKTAVTDTTDATDATGATDVTDVTDATKWTCDNGWEVCGKCNGTSCKVAGINTVAALRAEMASTAVGARMA
ncbi:hypothetical protein PEX2_106930 [Penicillium expansum]|uniref:Uncharacterized protein n=1 Tax=Penicillium expansum TaxID=27334 RepID=A0A0A2J969_PENEN|nr:hypothetical protein PEX2_106930 [Penicillium expansum]KGO41837.1 hypothetical protein PEXP_108430 [Penicillium expansum]KGO51168.1 hypothetical protein PEX2_106930 [Penicillium expansum]